MFIVPVSGFEPIKGLEGLESYEKKNDIKEGSFKNLLEEAIKTAEKEQIKGEQLDQLLAAGQIDDLHTALIQAEQTAAAVEFTTQLTSRAVSAYNQIMGMQV